MQINFLTQPLRQPLDNNPIKTDIVEKSDQVQSNTRIKSSEIEPVQDEKLKNLQNTLAEHNITLKFRLDEQTKKLVVEMIDDKTGDSIRQFPSEVSLRLSQMSIKIQGQFVDDKV